MNEPCRRAAAATGVLLLLLAAGCGGGLPPAADPDQAREALKSALDAWKEGRGPEDLPNRKPPVDFRDVTWERGGRLVKYEIQGEERNGLSVRFTVRLTLQDGRDRVVVYNADAGPRIVIRPNF